MATALAELTPNALLALPDRDDGSFYELSDGELIIVGRAGYRHERVKNSIAAMLFAWETRQTECLVFAKSMFTLDPRTARIPDVAVVIAERLPQVPDEDIWQVYPDMRFVRVRRQGLMRDFETDQTLTSPVLPNFEMAVNRFFAD